MKSLIGIAAVLLIAICISVYAAGGADYGRGPETDPVASAAVTALSTNLNASNITSGTLAAARLPATAVVKDATTLLTEGYFDVADTTQLVFIAAGVTNVIDADITTP